jgi:hypothetical protein
VNGVYSLVHIILIFFIWSGNHKFYIQFLRLLGLQSSIITPCLYLFDTGAQVNYMYTDLSKVFDRLYHFKLLNNLNIYSIFFLVDGCARDLQNPARKCDLPIG